MNAAEHYREAEAWLATAQHHTDRDNEPTALKYAQVHATLAVAAANGANQPPVRKEITIAKPMRGEEITDQMGDDPTPDGSCPVHACVLSAGHLRIDHLDEDGRDIDHMDFE